LAHLTFPEFLALFLREAHHVYLLVAPLLHGQLQAFAELLMLHISSYSSKVQFEEAAA
jgi:hypothetical protein